MYRHEISELGCSLRFGLLMLQHQQCDLVRLPPIHQSPYQKAIDASLRNYLLHRE